MSMNKKIIEALIEGEDSLQTGGLLFSAKSIAYKNQTMLSETQLNYLYQIISKNQFNLSVDQNQNYYLIYLYYMSFYNRSKEKELLKFEIPSYKDSNETLCFIFNLIELEDDFDKQDQKTILQLQEILTSFGTHSKLLREYLLYDYYMALLYIRLHDFEHADSTLNSLVNNYYDEVTEDILTTNFYTYFKLKIDILAWRILQERVKQGGIRIQNMSRLNSHLIMSEKEQCQRLFTESLELYKMFQQQKNLIATFKMAIHTADASEGWAREEQSIQILQKTYQQLKNSNGISRLPYKGNYIDILLQIVSRLIKFYILRGKWEESEVLLNEIEEISTSIILDPDVDKVVVKKYSFLTLLLKAIIRGEYNFSDKQRTIVEYYALLEQNETVDSHNLINVYVMNKYGQYTTIFNKLFNNVSNVFKNNLNLPFKQYQEYFFCVGSYISSLSETILSERSSNKQLSYLDNVHGLSKDIIKYIENSLTSSEKKEYMLNFFDNNYNQLIIIQIFYTYIYYHIFSKNYNQARKAFEHLDSFNKTFHLEVNSGYGIILKLKGDVEFKFKNFINAKKLYSEALEYFANSPHRTKMRGITLYSLGIIEFFNSNINEAKAKFNAALNELFGLKRLSKNKYLDEKIKIISDTLQMLG